MKSTRREGVSLVADQGLGLSFFDSEEHRVHSLGAHVAHTTDVGCRRRTNQDNHLVLPFHAGGFPPGDEREFVEIAHGRLLVAVADGMGGHFGGEVASRLCVENLAKEMVNVFQDLSGSQPDAPEALQRAVEATHQAVYAHAQGYAENQVMGTTLTAGLLHGARVELAQVGDSRAYLLRGGNLMVLTRDQTIGCQLRSRGEDPSRVDARIQEMLVQAVGAQAKIEVIMTAIDLEPHDLLLLCSDGLYKVVSPAEIVETLELEMGLQERAARLIALANESGGPDNITVILAEICQVESTS